jgi:hypothetical protein
MTRMTVFFGACLAALLVQSAQAQQPAAGSAPATKPAASQLQQACADDVKKFCPDVQPGDGRIMQCLRPHRAELSAGCKQAAMAAHKQHQQQQPPQQ